MERIIFVTQKVDPQHPALAATVRKLHALAALVDEVVVLTDGAVPGVLPANCRVVEFGASTQAGRGARYAAALSRELVRRPRPVAVVAHMCPIYAVLAAPLVRPFGVRLLLWYTHWHASGLLRAAERLCDAIVSVDVRSFPLASPKVVALGHGIEVEEFPLAPRPEPGPVLRVLMLGRTSSAKGVVQVVHGVVEARRRGLDASLIFHGPSLTPAEQAYRDELDALVAGLGGDVPITIADAVPRTEVPALLAACDVLVNNMHAGSPDKAVYEAAAAGVPVLASNPVFDALLEPRFLFDREDAGSLADGLQTVAALTGDERTQVGLRLRERVEASHSVASWAAGILRVAREGVRP
jgi:glycosyltransferase involved in cell wall biosynthesis